LLISSKCPRRGRGGRSLEEDDWDSLLLKPEPAVSFFFVLLFLKRSQAQVAHAYNPSYSEGRDQDCSPQANSLQDPILKKTIMKKRLMEWFKW
jgi:hypothetical protein